ncbi:hypothetical protein EZV61_10395 [Corallincola luteus]|uniref:Lipoprotein n=1 Tax=Corallincola luteus TaxID=1775177 RepID=A0ABY2ANM8_9GAMM|nr:hypothetical protein [Corallincola luteus]TCI03279.1 hypothetical protein EZV61_10395 [Corallincola luteus]
MFIGGCRSTPVNDLNNQSIPPGLSIAQVSKAILKAGNTRGWLMNKVEEGHIVAEIHVRSHFAAVDIRYNEKNYHLSYRDSDNLKYDGQNIHKKYNQWVNNLNLDIHNSLLINTL